MTAQHTLTRPVSGPAQNERLTAWGGAVLFVMLAVEGLTVLLLWSGHRDRGLALHELVGVALIPAVVQKLSSTGYRFFRYYSGNAAYRTAGPPQILLRLLAPVLILLTVEVLGTGTALLWVYNDYRHPLEQLHKLGFFLWFAVTAVHVLAYVRRVPRLVGSDLRPSQPERGGARTRAAITLASVAIGVVGSLALCRSLGIVTRATFGL